MSHVRDWLALLGLVPVGRRRRRRRRIGASLEFGTNRKKRIVLVLVLVLELGKAHRCPINTIMRSWMSTNSNCSLLRGPRVEHGKSLLFRVVSMLSKLVDRFSASPQVSEGEFTYKVEDEDDDEDENDPKRCTGKTL